MTDQSNPPRPHDGEETTDSSLFERASSTFGFDPFRPAPVPGKLDDLTMKRARAVRRAAVPDDVRTEPEIARTHDAEDRGTKSVPVAPVPTVIEGPGAAVRFSGEAHPIDRSRLRERGLIVPEAKNSALLEEFRIVKRQLHAVADQRGTAMSRRVLVCSPLPGEGKTFCSVNLALAMANERDSEVLLVDADFAKPSVLSALGLPKGPGLLDALSDPSINAEDLVMGTDIPGLWILPAGNPTDADSEWLASARTTDVLNRLTMGAPHRMVIFDSPPALAASPAAELAKHVGQVLLVARADQTGRSALEDAVDLLGACPDIKLLLNAAHFSPSGRRFGTYYGYEG
ncbi:MAG: capsular biosynthesis protein [Tsuneonella suprasediminis]|uniref:Capsular biosynthesis protein n=1 Tax=Tsuneonella suprasediminis TaxID=2306996 RepID=A0A419R0N2_9SPHN|nr:capsular biosynthesis protein [Tsuneonella suprasediminis]RJX67004.1 capsular biosynthesis protein [Tsuneonella suprasediminis]UBS32162.1 capsular biosynthesis protein [Altererythrobacter sp. N1]